MSSHRSAGFWHQPSEFSGSRRQGNTGALDSAEGGRDGRGRLPVVIGESSARRSDGDPVASSSATRPRLGSFISEQEQRPSSRPATAQSMTSQAELGSRLARFNGSASSLNYDMSTARPSVSTAAKTFLVPVGASGARQKLNIVSATSRARTPVAMSASFDVAPRSGPRLDRAEPHAPRNASPSAAVQTSRQLASLDAMGPSTAASSLNQHRPSSSTGQQGFVSEDGKFHHHGVGGSWRPTSSGSGRDTASLTSQESSVPEAEVGMVTRRGSDAQSLSASQRSASSTPTPGTIRRMESSSSIGSSNSASRPSRVLPAGGSPSARDPTRASSDVGTPSRGKLPGAAGIVHHALYTDSVVGATSATTGQERASREDSTQQSRPSSDSPLHSVSHSGQGSQMSPAMSSRPIMSTRTKTSMRGIRGIFAARGGDNVRRPDEGANRRPVIMNAEEMYFRHGTAQPVPDALSYSAALEPQLPDDDGEVSGDDDSADGEAEPRDLDVASRDGELNGDDQQGQIGSNFLESESEGEEDEGSRGTAEDVEFNGGSLRMEAAVVPPTDEAEGTPASSMVGAERPRSQAEKAGHGKGPKPGSFSLLLPEAPSLDLDTDFGDLRRLISSTDYEHDSGRSSPPPIPSQRLQPRGQEGRVLPHMRAQVRSLEKDAHARAGPAFNKSLPPTPHSARDPSQTSPSGVTPSSTLSEHPPNELAEQSTAQTQDVSASQGLPRARPSDSSPGDQHRPAATNLHVSPVHEKDPESEGTAALPEGSGPKSVKPAIPTKSKERQAVHAPGQPLPSSQDGDQGLATHPSIPADALKRTRKGQPVRTLAQILERRAPPRVANGGTARVVAPQDTGAHAPRAPPPGPASPIRSRFSVSQTDSTSLPSSVGGQVISFSTRDWDPEEDEADEPDELSNAGPLLPTSAWYEVEDALHRFERGVTENGPLDKGGLLRNVLLPFLALEQETRAASPSAGGFDAELDARRSLLFDWIRALLLELHHVQTSADRGAILESIACIIESRTLSSAALQGDGETDLRFKLTFGRILSYAIGELNKKGVYQNTLIFSGRLLAAAFFRIEGVASKLLRALPVNRFALERVACDAGWEFDLPADWESYTIRFPPLLRALCFQDARNYLNVLDAQSTGAAEEAAMDDDRFLIRLGEVEVEMGGNWLRRWQSDDSELFFSFCRSYHRQLASLLGSTRALRSVAPLFFGAPGYAHLATCVHQKCLSLVHRDILSVTTLSSQKNFNPGETANVLSGSTAGKPRHLEAANRRCTAIVVDIMRHPNGIFSPMLSVHIKCLVRRTSLYDVQGVFCLLDWIDGVFSHMDSLEMHIESFVDVSFVVDMVQLLLRDADHALALMRTIAFCYSNFNVLTSTSEMRTRFCEEILLDRPIFEKLFLSWSFTIRAYYLHLLVFRLARITDFPAPSDDPNGRTAVSVARLFNQRLDEVRRRHEDLSPSPPPTDSSSAAAADDDGPVDESRDAKPRPLSFVSTIKRTPSLTRSESAASSASSSAKAERILGIGMPDPILAAAKVEPKNQSRAAKWLRVLGGKSAKGRTTLSVRERGGAVPIDSPTISNEPRAKRLPALDELLDDDGGATARDDEDYGTVGNEAEGRRVGASEGEGRNVDPSTDIDAANDDVGSAGAGLADGIASDISFDLQSPSVSFPPPDGSGRVSPRHQSPRVSRSFSKRASILPGPAFELVSMDEGPPVPPVPIEYRSGYDKSLHIYAIQSLREYEQTVQEHDEYFAAQAEADSAPQVPRLPIAWPAMFSNSES